MTYFDPAEGHDSAQRHLEEIMGLVDEWALSPDELCLDSFGGLFEKARAAQRRHLLLLILRKATPENRLNARQRYEKLKAYIYDLENS